MSGRMLAPALSPLALALAAPLAGQALAVRGDSADFARHDFAAVAVAPRPWTTVVAITLVIPEGSAADPRDVPGSAWLLGETVRDAVQQRVARTGASVAVRVERAHTTFQVLAVPGAWHQAWDALVQGVFFGSPDLQSLNARRAELVDVLGFERGAPVREFEAELFSMVGGSSWNGDPRGTLASVARITATDLLELRRRIYRPREAVLTIVGALDAQPSVQVHSGRGNGDADRGRSGMAWSSGARERMVRDVTNSWIGVAFPVRTDVPRTSIEFVAQRLLEELNPSPRVPGLFGTRVRVEDVPDGPVLVVESAVFPDEQARWEERVVRVVESLPERHREPTVFAVQRRRFRNLRLTAEAAPEVEGRRMAMDLLREGRVRNLPAEVGSLDPEDVARVMEGLGRPRILVFGPSLGGGSR